MIGKPEDPGEDLLLVSRVVRGDTDAFGGLVRRYRGAIVSFAAASLGSRDDAEDAAQEIFIRAFRSLGAFDLSRRFKPWLYAVAVNTLKDARYRRVRRARETDAAARAEPPVYRSPHEEAERSEIIERIRKAVRSLPGKPREAALLYYIEGLDVSETAEALGIGEENVKSRLHRARKILRGFLDEDATAGR